MFGFIFVSVINIIQNAFALLRQKDYPLKTYKRIKLQKRRRYNRILLSIEKISIDECKATQFIEKKHFIFQ